MTYYSVVSLPLSIEIVWEFGRFEITFHIATYIQSNTYDVFTCLKLFTHNISESHMYVKYFLLVVSVFHDHKGLEYGVTTEGSSHYISLGTSLVT